VTLSGDDEIAILERKLAKIPENPELRLRSTRRKRSTMVAVDQLPPPAKDLPKGTSLEPSHTISPHEPTGPAQLVWSSDPRVAMLARNIDAMRDELRSNGPKDIVWPENVTYKNFIEFMFFPTLVYQLEYPRTTTRRPLYILEKVLATFGTFSLIYTVTEHYIMPYTPKPGDSLVHSFTQLAIPMIINFLL
jgi:sterol O-acyltransferase